MTSKRLVTGVVLALAVVTGCAESDDPTVGGPSPLPTTSATSTVAGSPSPTATAAVCAKPPFTATTARDTEAATGSILGLVRARASAQACYDRVVFDLRGRAAGAPGWRVEYVTKPTSDGSGNPVAVNGPAYLQVLITNTGYPDDTGVAEPAVKRFTPTGTSKVREVVLDGVFEGQYTAYIGISAKLPFRVFRLSNPARVVVDVRHS
jgi:hypothetical protein